MKQAPFKYGEIVTGQYFTNRNNEIKKLKNNFLSLQNTIIISPRRYGKSSLVKETTERFNQEAKAYSICNLDLMYIYSEEEFYNRFATTILKATSNKTEEFLLLAKNFIPGARLTINAGTGDPSVEFGINYIKDNIDKILNLPQEIARLKKKKIIICIDEFQNISRFEKHQELQGRLRSIWQHHDRVGYVLYGSKKTMMMEIFTETNSPFYKFGETLYLSRIQTVKLKEYLTKNFNLSGKEISDKICTRIIETVENHPYYVQQFARNIWLISGKVVSKSDFQQAKKALISDNLNFYNEMLEDFTSYQIGLLKALLYKENHLYSAKMIHTYKLGSTANVRRMYKAFENKGIIVNENGKVVFADPIFKIIAEEKFF
jgi:hypothetical protein